MTPVHTKMAINQQFNAKLLIAQLGANPALIPALLNALTVNTQTLKAGMKSGETSINTGIKTTMKNTAVSMSGRLNNASLTDSAAVVGSSADVNVEQAVSKASGVTSSTSTDSAPIQFSESVIHDSGDAVANSASFRQVLHIGEYDLVLQLSSGLSSYQILSHVSGTSIVEELIFQALFQHLKVSAANSLRFDEADSFGTRPMRYLQSWPCGPPCIMVLAEDGGKRTYKHTKRKVQNTIQ